MSDYGLYVSEDSTAMVHVWPNGKVEVATREDPDAVWGPPKELKPESEITSIREVVLLRLAQRLDQGGRRFETAADTCEEVENQLRALAAGKGLDRQSLVRDVARELGRIEAGDSCSEWIPWLGKAEKLVDRLFGS